MIGLFDRFQAGRLDLPNRIVMAPMTRARASEDGLATPSMATYYSQRATAGLIVSEGIAPSLQGQSNPGTSGLHTPAQVEAWRTVTSAVHAVGGRIFAQLQHAGRVGHEEVAGLTPVAPSAITLPGQLYTGPRGLLPAPQPRALDLDGINEQISAFVDAARRAMDAGFDGVELHGANGYLIQQFLSSNVNQRTDSYGGSILGRIRFATEVTEAVADAIGAGRLGLRISPLAGVWDIEEADAPELYRALLDSLAPLDLAYLHMVAPSDDGHRGPQARGDQPPGRHDVVADLRKQWHGVLIVNPSGMGSRETDKSWAEAWLADGADLISFGRAFVSNPDLVERLRDSLPLADAELETFYQGGDRGYIDYAIHQH